MNLPRHLSDTQRDAHKFSRLVRTLRHATDEIKAIENTNYDIEKVLARLLPSLAQALEAEQAFVARRSRSSSDSAIQLVAAHPHQELSEHSLPETEHIRKLLVDGRPVVVGDLNGDPAKLVVGLEVFHATSAILVRMDTLEAVYVIGVCNKASSLDEPFLAADRLTLNSIIELIAVGARTAERRRREMEHIREILAEISAELELEKLLPGIARRAAEVFGAPASSVMLWDQAHTALTIAGAWGMSDDYRRTFRIKAEVAYDLFGSEPDGAPTLLDQEPGVYGTDHRSVAPKTSQKVLAAPLVASHRFLGLLNIYGRSADVPLSEHDRGLIRIFAEEAALAIRNAQRYESERSRTRQFGALYEAGRSIAQAGVDSEVVLRTILDQAIAVTSAELGTIQLLQGQYLDFAAVCPAHRLSEIDEQVKHMPLSGRGITARAVRENRAQLVPNVCDDPDYLAGIAQSRSEVAVVMRGGSEEGTIIGVLNLEHPKENGFDRSDKKFLIALSNLAVSAIQNARQAEQLTRSNAVAVMGAWGADVVHDIHHEIGNIRRAVQILDNLHLPPETQPYLARIDQAAARLALPELQHEMRLGSGEFDLRFAPVLDGVLHNEIAKAQAHHSGVTITLAAVPPIHVRIPEWWLRRFFRHLLQNAVRAVNESGVQPKLIEIAATVEDGYAEITVQDNGKGVRAEIMPYLFRRPIDHVGPRAQTRAGRGLLLVSYVAELYGGEVFVKPTPAGQGACFAVRIPLVAETGSSG